MYTWLKDYYIIENNDDPLCKEYKTAYIQRTEVTSM